MVEPQITQILRIQKKESRVVSALGGAGCQPQLPATVCAKRNLNLQGYRQAAEIDRLAACAPRNYPSAAITLSSIAIGVGSAVTSIVVRVGFGLPVPAKYSA